MKFAQPLNVLRAVDRDTGMLYRTLLLSSITVVMLFPTGILNSNEEYYMQLAAGVWSGRSGGEFDVLMENSVHYWLNAVVIGLPVKWLGYEAANAVLRFAAALGLACGFAYLSSALRIGALGALVALAGFVLLDQQYIGNEWILMGIEGKVLAYIFVLFGMGAIFHGKWKMCVGMMAVATYFHFLVGAFWMLAALGWIALDTRQIKSIFRTGIVYALAVMPLVVAIAWQRHSETPPAGTDELWRIFSLERNAHHIAPFSSPELVWSWTPGIALLFGTLFASIVLLQMDLDRHTKSLLHGIFALQSYLVVVFLLSASEVTIRFFGEFFLFRPSSLSLFLVLLVFLRCYRILSKDRTALWMIACIAIPTSLWGEVKEKVEEYAWNTVDKSATIKLATAADRLAGENEIVLVQPGRDGERPETSLSRYLNHPTLVSWKYVPTLPSKVLLWDERLNYRASIFERGCEWPLKYPIGALIFRNAEPPADEVIQSCGYVAWTGPKYSIVRVN